jgi:tetratricopeptide (TPR) repeat protein
LEYYNHYKVYRQAEKHFEEVNDALENLLVNYSHYTFPAQVLISKLERHLRMGTEKELYDENASVFIDFETDTLDVPKHIIYVIYRALSNYYVGKYDEAAKAINNLLNEISLKKYPFAQMEVKALLALQYCLLKDFDLFTQLTNSIQRQVRHFGKDSCENVLLFIKIMKIAVSEAKKDKPKKIAALIPKFKDASVAYLAPTMLIRMDEDFISNLTAL